MSTPRHHAEWLNLVDTSGPFLALPALMRVFPQGLDTLDPELKKRVRLAFDEWLESQTGRPDPALHTAWIRVILHETRGYIQGTVVEPQAMPPSLRVQRGCCIRKILADGCIRYISTGFCGDSGDNMTPASIAEPAENESTCTRSSGPYYTGYISSSSWDLFIHSGKYCA